VIRVVVERDAPELERLVADSLRELL